MIGLGSGKMKCIPPPSHQKELIFYFDEMTHVKQTTLLSYRPQLLNSVFPENVNNHQVANIQAWAVRASEPGEQTTWETLTGL